VIRRLALVAIVIVAACAKPDPYPGYVRASDDVRAAVVRVVEDYYATRTRAAAARDAAVLFSAYPEIATGEDRSRGINADGFLMERMSISDIVTLEVDLEDREPISVLVRGDDALALVHGKETWHYRHGGPGLGEFLTRLDLRRGATGWVLHRTDEWLLGETPPPTPRR
jgi:hypothetical protein